MRDDPERLLAVFRRNGNGKIVLQGTPAARIAVVIFSDVLKNECGRRPFPIRDLAQNAFIRPRDIKTVLIKPPRADINIARLPPAFLINQIIPAGEKIFAGQQPVHLTASVNTDDSGRQGDKPESQEQPAERDGNLLAETEHQRDDQNAEGRQDQQQTDRQTADPGSLGYVFPG